MDEVDLDKIVLNSTYNTISALTTADIASLGTLDISTLNTMNYNYGSGAGSSLTGGLYNSTYHGNITIGNYTNQNSLDVKGDANFEGDIKFKGKSLGELFSKIEDRLAILQPDPKKLEKYEALRKAYEHYKTLERLVGED